jgi:hypothetical protein
MLVQLFAYMFMTSDVPTYAKLLVTSTIEKTCSTPGIEQRTATSTRDEGVKNIRLDASLRGSCCVCVMSMIVGCVQ